MDHVGRDCRPAPKTRGSNAFVVCNEWGPAKTNLCVWEHSRSNVLNAEKQLWVKPRYSGYRHAYRNSFPGSDLRSKVIHHVMNRRYAALHGYRYVRVVAISRMGNSSSGYSENWGVELTREGILRSREGTEQIAYADLVHVMSMLDIPIGGGVMDTVREANFLLKPRQSTSNKRC